MFGNSRPWLILPVVAAVAVRPMLWRAGIRAVRNMKPDRWWRRRPFLPVPAAEYLTFRLQTQYGGDGSNPPRSGDVLEYLRWLRNWS